MVNLIKDEGELLVVQCNLCKKEFTIKKEICSKTNEGYEANEKIRCNICGEQDSSIVDYKKMLRIYNVSEKKKNLDTFETEQRIQAQTMDTKGKIMCPKCGSTQITANKKGFSLLSGFIGSNKVLITCLKCGKQWQAGK